MSSLSVRFFNSYKSKYLNFFFYLFDCQVSFALIGFSFLHHRVLYVRLRCTSLDLGSALCAVVGLDGLEPSTSRLSGARSSHLSYRPVSHLALGSLHFQGSLLDGGDEGIRTLDPLLAGQVLSQLSYTPMLGFIYFQDSIES